MKRVTGKYLRYALACAVEWNESLLEAYGHMDDEGSVGNKKQWEHEIVMWKRMLYGKQPPKE